MATVVKKTFRLSLQITIFCIIVGWAGIIAYYNRTIKFPSWYKTFNPSEPECTDPLIFQNKFNTMLVSAEIKSIFVADGELKAWHLKATKNRKNKGVILVHGGGGDHNLLNPYAHILSLNGWDSLSIDLPNHGCSYNNKKGIRHGTEESKNFTEFYSLATKLFKVEGIIATSMGALVAAPEAFKNNWPVKLFLENPMISFEKIVTEQKSYYVPPTFKSFFEWQLLKLNTDLNKTPLYEEKPNSEQKILILYGTKDTLTPPDQAKYFLKHWQPVVRVEYINGARHADLIQHAPGLIQKLVEDFIIKVP